MSKTNRIPLVYHPTNILALDDHIEFLKGLAGILDVNIPYLIDTDPQTALDYLAEHTYQEDATSNLITNPNFDMPATLDAVEHFSVDFSKLRSELSKPERFDKITVAFVDKQMPKMDGLEFCRKVREKNLQVKLILLTGNTGLDEAVSAFNEGIIDSYISKGRRDLDKTINFYAANESWNQFVELGRNVSGLPAHTLKSLNDEKFSEFFHEIWRDHQQGEFYLADSSCSFLFFDYKGDATLLYVRNPQDFEEVYEMAKNDEVSESVLNALKNKEAFPITPQKNGYLNLHSSTEWEKAMLPLKLIAGTDLRYIQIPQPNTKAFSFDRYFSEVWTKNRS